MTGSSGTNTSGSGQSPEDGSADPEAAFQEDGSTESEVGDVPTVAWEMPIGSFAGIRDPSSKAVGAGLMLAIITAAFRFDIAAKELVADLGVLLGTLVTAYGPRAQLYLLNINADRMAQTQLDKLEKMAAAHPDDVMLQKKAAAARGIVADGWLSRIHRSLKPASRTPKALADGKPKKA